MIHHQKKPSDLNPYCEVHDTKGQHLFSTLFWCNHSLSALIKWNWHLVWCATQNLLPIMFNVGRQGVFSSDRSSYSDIVLLYIYISGHFFHIFTQSIAAIDVTTVTLSRCNSINAIDVTRWRLVHWSSGPLAHWSIGPLVHWFIGPLLFVTLNSNVY